MTCIKCGKELAQGSKFCTACGTIQPQNVPGTAGQEGKKPKKGAAGMILGALAALGLILYCAVKLLSGAPLSDDPDYAWVTDDAELFVAPNFREKTEGTQVSDRVSVNSQVEFSPDGKWLYFTEQSEADGEEKVGDLYRISLTGKVEENRAEKLGSDVVSFRQTENGVLWLEKWGANYRLYHFDGEEDRRLATLPEPVYELDGEETFAYYLTREDDVTMNGVSLHRVPLAGGESETLVEDVSTVYGDWTGKYLFTHWEEETRGYAVYRTLSDGEWAQLAVNVSEDRLMDVELEDSISFSYLVTRKETVKLSDLVTDRYAEEDAETLSAAVEVAYPEEPTEPDWEDYGASRVRKERDGEWYYTSLNGSKTYHMEATPEFIYEMTGYEVTQQMINMYKPLLSESIMSEVAGYMADILWERAYAEYEKELEIWYDALDAYYEAMDSAEQAYREAMAREMVRENLKNAEYFRSMSDLYRFENGEHTLLASGLDAYSLAESEGIFLYDKPSAEIGILADVSELESADEAFDLLEQEMSRIVRCQNVDGVERELELEADAHVEHIDVLSESEVILRVYSGEELSLRSFALGENGLRPANKLPEGEVYKHVALFEGENGKELLYLRNVEHVARRMSGELYRYADGKETLLTKDAVGYYRTERGTVFLLTADETTEGAATATLTLLNGEERVEVDEEVRPESLRVLEDGRVLYLKDDDLYIWESGESRCLRRNISAFWASVAEPYTLFAPVIW